MVENPEERYRRFYRHAPVPMHSVDAAMRLIDVNQRWLDLLGYRREDVIGRLLTDLMTPESADRHRTQSWPHLRAGAAIDDVRYELVRSDGTPLSVLYSARADGDAADGSFHTVATFIDATRRVRAEAALHASEEQYRLLVNGVTDYAIYTLDPTGVVSNWNAGAERIKGWRADEIIGHNFARFYTPEDRAKGEPQRVLETAAREGKYEAEALRVRKDGSHFWASVAIDPLRDDAGTIIGFAKITRDITERIETARMLEATREALAQAQKMEAVGHLTGGIAHDFNNLLTAIIGSLDLMREGFVPLDDQARPLVEAALRAAQRGASLTTGLLAFSRRQALAPQPIDVNKLVSSMSQLLRQTLGVSVRIETVLAGGLWRTEVDPNQLESALLNLALNARDAMPEGGRLTIETGNGWLDEDYAARRAEVTPGQYVMIAVTDTGAGMSAETMARVFEPFFTTKPEGRGTGLGLSQVYGFIKQSGGHTAIYSEIGKGTTVRIYLPRHFGDAPAEPVTSTVPDEARGNRETVLVVEDDAEVRQFSVAALRTLGYHVLEADGAPAALALLERQPEVALLFTDVGLPGMNGRQLADAARALVPRLKVLFTTGYARNAIVHHGILDAGVHMLAKPFTITALGRRIREILSGD